MGVGAREPARTCHSMTQLITALWLVVLSQSAPCGEQAPPPIRYPSCNFEKASRGHLTSQSTFDTVRITVRGTPCYEAPLLLEIRNTRGVVVYRYAADFKRHTAIQWDDEGLPTFAEGVAEAMSAGWDTADKLPELDEIKPASPEADPYYFLQVSHSRL